jgi:hypothetical protein
MESAQDVISFKVANPTSAAKLAAISAAVVITWTKATVRVALTRLVDA